MQPKAVYQILNECGVNFWLDSGSLLGLIRDKKFMDWDSDIDLGIWESDLPKMDEALKKFNNLGFYTNKGSYNKNKYIFTVKDNGGCGFKPLHIHVFFKSGEFAFSPQTVYYKDSDFDPSAQGFCNAPITRAILMSFKRRAKSRNKGGWLAKIIKKCVHYPIWGAFVMVRNSMDRMYWSLRYPFSVLHAAYTWTIPAHYFEKLDSIDIDGLQIPVPSKTNEYLRCRYGDWKMPIQNWNYWLDDGCIECIRPEVKCPSIFK
jgi:hypothetical protein